MVKEILQFIPPVVTIPVECSLDRVIARDTARRVAAALGFHPMQQAQLGTAAADLCDLLLKTNIDHEAEYSGVTDGLRTGVQIRCRVPWLANVSAQRVQLALQIKLQNLAHEVHFLPTDTPIIELIVWATDPYYQITD